MTETSNLQRFANWRKDYGAPALPLVFGGLFGLFGLCTSEEFCQQIFGSHAGWHDTINQTAFALSFIFGLLTILSGVWALKHQKRITRLEKTIYHERREFAAKLESHKLDCESTISELQNTIENLEDEQRLTVENVRNLVEGYLLRLATGALDFGKKPENTERVTLYAFDPAGFFFSLGRYSPHADYNEVGKSEHSPDCGCIGKAWKDGWCFDAKFRQPHTKTYLKQQANYGFSKDDVENFSMKSQLYCGCRIMDRADSEPIAVLLIESTDPKRFTEQELRDALLRDEVRYLSDLIEGVRDLVTNPSRATELGY